MCFQLFSKSGREYEYSFDFEKVFKKLLFWTMNGTGECGVGILYYAVVQLFNRLKKKNVIMTFALSVTLFCRRVFSWYVQC